MRLGEIIVEMIDIKLDQKLEDHCDSHLHTDDPGILCGEDKRTARLDELQYMLDAWRFSVARE